MDGAYFISQHKALNNNPLHSDVILIVGQSKKLIYANKQILAQFSPYYKAAFNESWKQSKTDDHQQQILTHLDIEKDTMMLILEYMYIGSTAGIHSRQLSLVYLAEDFLHNLQLDNLMGRNLTKETP